MDVVSSIDIVHTCQMPSIVVVLLQVQFYLVGQVVRMSDNLRLENVLHQACLGIWRRSEAQP